MGGGELQHKLAEANNQSQDSSNNVINNSEQQNNNTQTNTNTLNINKATSNNNVTTLADSKVEDTSSQQAQATNVDLTLEDSYNKPITETQYQSWNYVFASGVKGSFTVNTSDLKAKKTINIATLNFTSNNGKLPKFTNEGYVDAIYQGKKIGTIGVNDSTRTLVLTPDAIASQNLLDNSSIDINFELQHSIDYSCVNVPHIFARLQGKDYQFSIELAGKTYNYDIDTTVPLLNPQLNNPYVNSETNYVALDDGNANIDDLFTNGGLTADNINISNQQGSLNNKIVPRNLIDAYLWKPSDSNYVLSQLNLGRWSWFPLVNSDGQLLQSTGGVSLKNYRPSVIKAPDNATLNDITKLSKDNSIVYSIQNNGNILFYVNVLSSVDNITDDDLNKAIDNSNAIDTDKNGTEAFKQANLNFYKNNRQATILTNIIYIPKADATAVQTGTFDKLDINTGKVLKEVNYKSPVNSVNLKGQSEIKIHYIDGSNGTNLKAVKSQIGKAGTAINVAAPIIPAGYTLRTNHSNKLFNGKTVNGTVLNGTQDNNVILPAENTITDVYYIVDPQTQNITINYIDQTDNKQLKSDKISGYSDSKANYNVQNNISNYKKQGYKLIKSEVPSVLQFDHDTSKDQVYNVYLGYDKEQAKITYIDDTTGKTLKSETAAGKVDSNIAFPTNVQDKITSLEGQGYKLVSNNYNSPVYSSDANKNVFEVHFVHATSNVTQKVTIKRTINYLDKATNKPVASPVEQDVTFEQPGVQDMVTSQVNWQPVDNQEFEAVTSPDIKGYLNPDKASVEAQSVGVNDRNSTVNVYYTKDVVPKLSITNNQGHKPTSNNQVATDNKQANNAVPTVNNGANVQLPTNTITALQDNNKQALAQTNVQNSSNAIVGLAMAGGILTLGLTGIVKKHEE